MTRNRCGEEILNLAKQCHDLLQAIPGEHHEGWTEAMKALWRLGGLDSGGAAGSLTLESIERCHKKLAKRLHPDKLNNVMDRPNSNVTASQRQVFGGLYASVQQKYQECQMVLRGGPVRVAPITEAAACFVTDYQGKVAM